MLYINFHLQSDFRGALAKQILAEAESRLKKLRSLTMEDYDMELRQLKLDFGE